LAVIQKKICPDWRIRQEPEIVELFVDFLVEKLFFKSETERNGTHNIDMDVVARLKRRSIVRQATEI